MVVILLGNGFEEMEAITPCDLLRRAGIQVCFAGIGGKRIAGAHGICIEADCAVETLAEEKPEMVILPGGLGGVASIRGSACAMELIARQHREGRPVAAICAAPTILAELGITDGKKATCYPGMEAQMGAAVLLPEDCVAADGSVITGRAAGTAIQFALHLIASLRGREAAQQVADSIVFSG